MNDVVFVDTETTGLHPDRHEIWEVALVDESDVRMSWFLPVDLKDADPIALSIGGFHKRHPWGNASGSGSEPCSLDLFVNQFLSATDGKHLVGAVPSFDEERLRRLVWKHGRTPSWHYHLVDVEVLVAGRLGIRPPWNSDELSRLVGVEVAEEDRHTALGDALWAKALYEQVMA